jgi:hypothetical protein
VGEGAVVYVGDGGAGDPLAQLVGEDAGLLGHAGGLQEVAHGLVEENPAEAGPHHHGEGAGGGGLGAEVGQGLAGGFLPHGLGGVEVKELQAHALAGPGVARLHLGAVLGHRQDEEPGPDPPLLGQDPFGVGDQDLLFPLQEARFHLADLGGDPGAAFRLQKPLQAVALVLFPVGHLGGVEAFGGPFAEVQAPHAPLVHLAQGALGL